MLKRLLNIDPKDALQVLDLHFRTPWAQTVFAVLVLAAVVYAVEMYRRERQVFVLLRLLLGIFRVLAISVILFVLLRPTLTVNITRSEPSNLLVLVDSSDSMSIRDTRKERDQLVDAALAMGRMKFDQPERQRAVYKATTAMRAAAEAMRLGKAKEAAEIQGQIQETLVTVRKLVQRRHPDGAAATTPQELEQLDTIIKQQTRIHGGEAAKIPGVEESVAAAKGQETVAQDLENWNRAVQDARLTISDRLKPEMAKVSRHNMAVDMLTALPPEGLDLAGQLDRLFAVRYFRLGETLEPLSPDRKNLHDTLTEMSTTAAGTDIGSAIDHAVNRYNGQPVSGIVLLTDGAVNMGPDPLEVAQHMRDRGIPLYTLGIGLPKPDDVCLQSLVVQDVVFANDLVPLRVQILSSGYEKRATSLSVRLDDDEVASKQITLTGKAQFEEITFRASRTAGTRKLEVVLAPLPNEATEDNNRISRSLRVSDQKIKVLCIEGSPRWEYRYLRAVLKRDPRIEAQFITTEGDIELARASKEHLARFPDKADQAFSYDLVIMGDVKATTFTPTQMDRLEELVRERGGSFIMLAGHKHAPAEYVDTPIAKMLPVWPEQGKWEEVDKDAYPVITPDGQQSTVMQLDPSESKNRALWANVKPLIQLPPLEGAKPGARVLAELSETMQRSTPLPLIAWQRYGSGKVMFIATDRLWRMRIKSGDKYHARFWGQVIQFLTLSRLLGENKRVRLEINPNEGRAGQPMQICANVLDEKYEPATAPAWRVAVQNLDKGGEDEVLQLQPVPELHGLFHGNFVPREAGRYQLNAMEEDRNIANSVEFTVGHGAAEQADVTMRQDVLKKMAELSGGRYLSVRDLPGLPDMLTGSRRNITIRKEVELWDNWVLLLLFVGLVSLEWSLRRNRDLA